VADLREQKLIYPSRGQPLALCQGMTSVMPKTQENEPGFSP
jgi:hypothetical protein